MKKLFYILFAAALFIQQSFAQSVIVGTVKDSVTGSNILSGAIEFIPIDTPKTNSAGELLFGYKTIAYINNGKFAAILTEGLYDCVVGPFNITKPITIPAGTNVIDLATIYGNTDNSLVTFFQFASLSNSLASMITGSVSGVSTFNGRSGAITLTSNDVYAIDIAAEKIKFTSDAYTADTNVLAFAVLSVDNELSAATNARSLIVQSLGVDPATNAINSITNEFATKAYVNISTNGFATTSYVTTAVYNATNGISGGSMDYSVTNNFATTNYVNLRQLIGDTNKIPSGDYVGVFKDSSSTSVLDWNELEDKWVIPTAIGFEFTEIPTIGGANVATTTYVNTATNNFITIANAQALTNNFATIQSVTNAVYVASKPSRITNAQDTVEIILGIKSLFITNMAGNVTLTGPTFQSTTNEETTRLVFNANGADRTVALPAAIRTPDGARTYYVTNNTTAFLTVGGISGSYTTAVFKVLW